MSDAQISPCRREKADEENSPNCGGESSVPSNSFDCSICLDLSQDPVVTMCGHLFCWSCLYQWITIHSTFQECPVCKACVKDKIIPLYGRGKGHVADANAKMVHESNIPRPPQAAQQSFVAVDSMPSSAGFQHRGFVSVENHGSRRGQSTYSAASFGLFPALFGFHLLTLPEYGSGFSSGTNYNVSSRSPAISRVAISQQQRRMDAQQEFMLYWFLILLACFAILCFLFF